MDNKTLERIASALERIAAAMEGGAKAPAAAVQAVATAAATVAPKQPPAATSAPAPAPAQAKSPGEPLIRLRNAFIGAMQRNPDAVKTARTKLPGQDFTKFTPEQVEMAIALFDGVTE